MRLLNILRACFWISLGGVWAINRIYSPLELAGILLYLIPLTLLIPYVVQLLRRES